MVEANESENDPVVVILAEEEKEDMDEFLRNNWTDRRNLRVVTRSGPTASLASLDKVAAKKAEAAIVLATAGEAASDEEKLTSDALVIKTVLAITAAVGEETEINIVAEVFDPRNRDVVKDISPERISVIDAQEILAKIMVQTSRTSGLSVVYAELLSFAGLRDVLPRRQVGRHHLWRLAVPLPRRCAHRHPQGRRRHRDAHRA